MEKNHFDSCKEDMQKLEKKLEMWSPQVAYKKVHQKIVQGWTQDSDSSQLALLLYYLYGPHKACSSFEWLYPHGAKLRGFVEDLARMRDHLSPQSARKHMQWGVSRLAHGLVTRLGRQRGVHATLHYAKKGVKTVVRSVARFGSMLSQASFWITALKPVICLIGLVVTYYGGFDNKGLTNVITAMGWSRSIVHVLLGDAAGKAMLQISDLYNVLKSMKDSTGVDQVLFFGFSVLNYLKEFLTRFLPHSYDVWNKFMAISDATQMAGLFTKGISMFWAGETSNIASTAGASARVAAGVLGVIALPIEAFARLGYHVVSVAQYVSGGENMPFYLNALVMFYMAWQGNYAYIVLKFMEYSCTVYHSGSHAQQECKDRVAGYRRLLNFLSSVQFVYKFFFGGLLSEFIQHVAILLREPLSTSFRTLCIGEITQPDLAVMRKETLVNMGYTEEEAHLHTMKDLSFEEVTGFPDPDKFFSFSFPRKDYRKYVETQKSEDLFLKVVETHNAEVALAKYEHSWQHLLHQHKEYTPEKETEGVLQSQVQRARMYLRDAAHAYEKELEAFGTDLRKLRSDVAVHKDQILTADQVTKMWQSHYANVVDKETLVREKALHMGVQRATGSETAANIATGASKLAEDIVGFMYPKTPETLEERYFTHKQENLERARAQRLKRLQQEKPAQVAMPPTQLRHISPHETIGVLKRVKEDTYNAHLAHLAHLRDQAAELERKKDTRDKLEAVHNDTNTQEGLIDRTNVSNVEGAHRRADKEKYGHRKNGRSGNNIRDATNADDVHRWASKAKQDSRNTGGSDARNKTNATTVDHAHRLASHAKQDIRNKTSVRRTQ
jgi:hypothetical protein